jgi:hypothetical protein
LLVSLIFSNSSIIVAQTQLSFKEPNPSSPTAASFQKFIDIPVSNHTGVPNISIPIHTVVEGPLSTSISLSYNSSGIKVEEMASWVGLGWSLSAQGMISRSVQGKRDESGFLVNPGIYPVLVNTTPCNTNNPNCDYGPIPCPCTGALDGVLNGNLDAEPDIFSFSFGGYSGKFVFSADGQIRFLSAQDVKITPNYQGDFDKWLAVTPDGTKYYFGNTFNRNAKEYSTDGSGSFNEQSTSWYLSRIESQDGIYWIDFLYASEDYNYYSRTGHSLSINKNSINEAKPNVSKTFVYAKRLTSIQTSTTKTTVTFTPSATKRQDISTVGTAASGSYGLSEIGISVSGVCKKFVLNQDYFQGLTTTIYHVAGQTENDADTKRLRLNYVQELTCDGTINIPAYIFTYNSTTLPRRLSLARDMFNYYNGYDSNQGLLPDSIPTGRERNYRKIAPYRVIDKLWNPL